MARRLRDASAVLMKLPEGTGSLALGSPGAASLMIVAAALVGAAAGGAIACGGILVAGVVLNEVAGPSFEGSKIRWSVR